MSVLDYVRSRLDPAIFNVEASPPTMYVEVRDALLGRLHDFLAEKGYKNPEAWITAHNIVGSSLTNQWHEDTDLDVHSDVDTDAFRMFEGKPDLSDDEIQQELNQLFFTELNKAEDRNLVYTSPEGDEVVTRHPREYYVELAGQQVPDAEYNLDAMEWTKLPDSPDEDFDPETELAEVWNASEQMAENLDLELGQLRRDLVDWMKAAAAAKATGRAWLVDKTKDKLRDIDRDILMLIDDLNTAKDARKLAFQAPEEGLEEAMANQSWAPGNIVFKYLQRYGYLDILKRLKELMKDGFTPEDIPEIAEKIALGEEELYEIHRLAPEMARILVDGELGQYEGEDLGDRLQAFKDEIEAMSGRTFGEDAAEAPEMPPEAAQEVQDALEHSVDDTQPWDAPEGVERHERSLEDLLTFLGQKAAGINAMVRQAVDNPEYESAAFDRVLEEMRDHLTLIMEHRASNWLCGTVEVLETLDYVMCCLNSVVGLAEQDGDKSEEIHGHIKEAMTRVQETIEDERNPEQVVRMLASIQDMLRGLWDTYWRRLEKSEAIETGEEEPPETANGMGYPDDVKAFENIRHGAYMRVIAALYQKAGLNEVAQEWAEALAQREQYGAQLRDDNGNPSVKKVQEAIERLSSAKEVSAELMEALAEDVAKRLETAEVTVPTPMDVAPGTQFDSGETAPEKPTLAPGGFQQAMETILDFATSLENAKEMGSYWAEQVGISPDTVGRLLESMWPSKESVQTAQKRLGFIQALMGTEKTTKSGLTVFGMSEKDLEDHEAYEASGKARPDQGAIARGAMLMAMGKVARDRAEGYKPSEEDLAAFKELMETAAHDPNFQVVPGEVIPPENPESRIGGHIGRPMDMRVAADDSMLYGPDEFEDTKGFLGKGPAFRRPDGFWEKMDPENLSIVHHRDQDGFGAAMVLLHAYDLLENWRDGRVKLHDINYGEEVPDVSELNRQVLVVDFSPGKEAMEGLAAEHPVLMVDHHASAEEECGDLPYAYFDTSENRCGMGLIHDICVADEGISYGHNESEDGDEKETMLPWIIRYTQDSDLGKWELPDTDQIGAFIRSLPLDVEDYLAEVKDMGATEVPGYVLEAGRNVERFQNELINAMLGLVQMRNHDSLGEVASVNSSTLCSQIGKALREEYPVILVWSEKPDGQITVNLYSNDGDPDVSKVAQEMGGGGHPGASGATVSSEDFDKLFPLIATESKDVTGIRKNGANIERIPITGIKKCRSVEYRNSRSHEKIMGITKKITGSTKKAKVADLMEKVKKMQKAVLLSTRLAFLNERVIPQVRTWARGGKDTLAFVQGRAALVATKGKDEIANFVLSHPQTVAKILQNKGTLRTAQMSQESMEETLLNLNGAIQGVAPAVLLSNAPAMYIGYMALKEMAGSALEGIKESFEGSPFEQGLYQGTGQMWASKREGDSEGAYEAIISFGPGREYGVTRNRLAEEGHQYIAFNTQMGGDTWIPRGGIYGDTVADISAKLKDLLGVVHDPDIRAVEFELQPVEDEDEPEIAQEASRLILGALTYPTDDTVVEFGETEVARQVDVLRRLTTVIEPTVDETGDTSARAALDRIYAVLDSLSSGTRRTTDQFPQDYSYIYDYDGKPALVASKREGAEESWSIVFDNLDDANDAEALLAGAGVANLGGFKTQDYHAPAIKFADLATAREAQKVLEDTGMTLEEGAVMPTERLAYQAKGQPQPAQQRIPGGDVWPPHGKGKEKPEMDRKAVLADARASFRRASSNRTFQLLYRLAADADMTAQELTEVEAALKRTGIIRKTPGKEEWCVKSKDGKKNLGCYDSKKKATKRLQQVEYFKRQGEAALGRLVLMATKMLMQGGRQARAYEVEGAVVQGLQRAGVLAAIREYDLVPVIRRQAESLLPIERADMSVSANIKASDTRAIQMRMAIEAVRMQVKGDYYYNPVVEDAQVAIKQVLEMNNGDIDKAIQQFQKFISTYADDPVHAYEVEVSEQAIYELQKKEQPDNIPAAASLREAEEREQEKLSDVKKDIREGMQRAQSSIKKAWESLETRIDAAEKEIIAQKLLPVVGKDYVANLTDEELPEGLGALLDAVGAMSSTVKEKGLEGEGFVNLPALNQTLAALLVELENAQAQVSADGKESGIQIESVPGKIQETAEVTAQDVGGISAPTGSVAPALPAGMDESRAKEIGARLVHLIPGLDVSGGDVAAKAKATIIEEFGVPTSPEEDAYITNLITYIQTQTQYGSADILDQMFAMMASKNRTGAQVMRTAEQPPQLKKAKEEEEKPDPNLEEYRKAIMDEYGIDIKNFKENVPGGLAQKKKVTAYPLDELLMGIGIEMEHTDDLFVALEIAMDHLEEFDDYYTNLTAMEHEMEVGGAEAALASAIKMKRKAGRKKSDPKFWIAKAEGDVREALWLLEAEKEGLEDLYYSQSKIDFETFDERTGKLNRAAKALRDMLVAESALRRMLDVPRTAGGWGDEPVGEGEPDLNEGDIIVLTEDVKTDDGGIIPKGSKGVIDVNLGGNVYAVFSDDVYAWPSEMWNRDKGIPKFRHASKRTAGWETEAGPLRARICSDTGDWGLYGPDDYPLEAGIGTGVYATYQERVADAVTGSYSLLGDLMQRVESRIVDGSRSKKAVRTPAHRGKRASVEVDEAGYRVYQDSALIASGPGRGVRDSLAEAQGALRELRAHLNTIHGALIGFSDGVPEPEEEVLAEVEAKDEGPVTVLDMLGQTVRSGDRVERARDKAVGTVKELKSGKVMMEVDGAVFEEDGSGIRKLEK